MGLTTSSRRRADHVPTTIVTPNTSVDSGGLNDEDENPQENDYITSSISASCHGETPRDLLRKISAVTIDPEIQIKTNWSSEVYLLVALAAPTVAIQLGTVLPNFLVASQVGRLYGSLYLDGFTLANLMGNLCNLSLLQGIFTASDTLGPQAFCAKNYAQVGLLAIRGVVAGAMILIPINFVLVTWFRPMMVAVGENNDAAKHAQDYYRVFVLALPFYVIYNATWKFLSSQEIMMPLVLVCAFCCIFVLPLGVYGFCQESWLGFLGSAWTVVLFQSCQAILLLVYLWARHPHTRGTWPGLSWKSIQQALFGPKGTFKTYLWLGLGGMLATSEWIYWESLTLLIGTMGVVPLSVHTIPTQVLMLGFMPGFGIGIGLAVRLGATLPLSVERAGKLTAGTFVACVVLFASMSLIMYGCRGWIFSLFTTEEAVIDGAHEIWRKVCIYYFNLCIYALNMGIATGLGQQWMFGTVTVTTLWGVSLPSMYYLCIIRGGGLSTAWACITQPYIAMNAFLVFQFFFRLDWKDIQHAIRIREGMDHRMSIDAPLVDNGESHNGHPLGLDRSVQMRESSSTIDERTGLLLVQNGVHAHNY